jgi:hypothetical protein
VSRPGGNSTRRLSSGTTKLSKDRLGCGPSHACRTSENAVKPKLGSRRYPDTHDRGWPRCELASVASEGVDATDAGSNWIPAGTTHLFVAKPRSRARLHKKRGSVGVARSHRRKTTPCCISERRWPRLPWEGKDAAQRLIRGAAAGAIPRRSPPPRLLLCEASLTSSPGRVPPQGIVTQRPSARRTGVKRRPRRMRWEKERRGQRQRPGAVSEVVGKGVAPASTPLYGGPWGRRICRVATLRSARWPLLLRRTAENAVKRKFHLGGPPFCILRSIGRASRR